MVPKRRRPWGTWTRPAATVCSGRCPVTGRPLKTTRPAVTRTSPVSAPSSVDLPAPLAPISATSSPGQMSRSTSNRTGIRRKPASRRRTSSSGSPSGIAAAGVALTQVGLDHPAVAQDLRGRAFQQRPPQVQDQGAVANADDDLHHVLDQDAGDAAGANLAPPLQRLLHLHLAEPGHDLVEQQESRRHGEGARELKPLAVAD